MFPSRKSAFLKSLFLGAARICVIGATVIVAGCASKQASHQPPSHVAGPSVPPGYMKVEIEEDGLPAQLAPRNPRPMPDDPREPWSPNYGRAAPAKVAESTAPAGAPPSPRVETAPPVRARPQPTRVSSVDEDEIIRRAIAEHEMRRAD